MLVSVRTEQLLKDEVFLGLLSLHDQPYEDVGILIEDMTNAGEAL